MNLQELNDRISRRFPKLPEGSLYTKYDIQKIYYNAEEKGYDRTFHLNIRGDRIFVNFGKRDEAFENKEATKKYWESKLEIGHFGLKKTVQEIFTDFQGSKPASPAQDGMRQQFGKKTDGIVSEFFELDMSKCPHLHSYNIKMSAGQLEEIGGKLAYRMQKEFLSPWTFSSKHLFSGQKYSQQELDEVVRILWDDETKVFQQVLSIFRSSKRPSNYDKGRFVLHLMREEKGTNIWNLLVNERKKLLKVTVTKEHELRPWDIKGVVNPVISSNISSSALYEDDLSTYIAKNSPEKAIGLYVKDKNSTLKGEVVRIIGKLEDHRSRLERITTNFENLKILATLADTELVVSVLSMRNKFDYPSAMLAIIVRSKDYHPLNINGFEIQKEQRIAPDVRSKLTAKVENIITSYLKRNLSQENYSQLFGTAKDLAYTAKIKFGNNYVTKHGKDILNIIQRNGIYKKSDKLSKTSTLGIIHLDYDGKAENYVENELVPPFRRIGITLEHKYYSSQGLDEIPISEILQEIAESSTWDCLLTTLSKRQSNKYDKIKAEAVGRLIPTQNMETNTTTKKFATGNIILGILGKTGNIPYVLADPIDFADYVAGIDVAREVKSNLPGTMNITAIARVYFSDGDFLKYVVENRNIEGETLPTTVIQKMFPEETIRNKRILIQRDGLFRGNEVKDFKEWGKRYNANFLFIEVNKRNQPRLYRNKNGTITKPEKGDYMLINDKEAIMVSSLPPFDGGTPAPLRIRVVESAINIKQAMLSVLQLTDLHYGSLLSPKLPVVIHFSDIIADMARKGIFPKYPEGDVPYWL